MESTSRTGSACKTGGTPAPLRPTLIMKPTYAASSIMPSMPMFTIPLRSLRMPLIAPRAIGTVPRMLALITATTIAGPTAPAARKATARIATTPTAVVIAVWFFFAVDARTLSMDWPLLPIAWACA